MYISSCPTLKKPYNTDIHVAELTRPKAYSYIRFSTPEQEKGDSLRRQIELSEVYAREHGLDLDDSLKLTDRGLSAFNGLHRTKGTLGQFLKLVEQGEIPKGSSLLVESLDRLSREQVLDALTQFTSIIQAGIKVVTLADKMEYDRKSINANFGQLLMSLVIMSRAHEESAMKSRRLKEAWQNKREQASNGGRKLTARCPAWLRLSEDKTVFEAIPERAQVIRQIYQMRLEGKGPELIAKTLNESKPLWMPKNGWRKSYIAKILNSQAIRGVYQPHHVIKVEQKVKRVPIGKPILDYYPATVEKALFNRVQALIKANGIVNGNAGGKTGKLGNLFTHIVKCAECGRPMAYINKGKRDGRLLICDRARRGLGCTRARFPYDRFEALILTYCKGLDVRDILPGNEQRQSELKILQNELQALDGEMLEIQGKIDNLKDSIASTASKELRKELENDAENLLTRRTELTEQRQVLGNKISRLQQAKHDTKQQLASVSELIECMGSLEGEARIDLRVRLRTQLRHLIRKIRISTDRQSIALFFQTGERRGLFIGKGKEIKVLDAYPKVKAI